MVLKEFFSSEYFESWAKENSMLIAAAFVQYIAPRENIVQYTGLIPGEPRMMARICLKDFQRLWYSCHEKGFVIDHMPVIDRWGCVADGNHRIAYCLVRGMPILVKVASRK